MLRTSFPQGADLPAPPAPRAKRKRGKVGRSYVKLGSPEFFKTPVTWGNTPVAKAIIAQGGERVSRAGKGTQVEYPDPRSPERGTIVKGCPDVRVGAGASLSEASTGRSPTTVPTQFTYDGDRTRDRETRRAIVRQMIKNR